MNAAIASNAAIAPTNTGRPLSPDAPSPRPLSDAEADALGRALDALRDEVVSELGQTDVDHIQRVRRAASNAELAGRALLHVGIGPASFALGTAALGVAKILENMEIGHNVMHGQYDWTRDPDLDSKTYEWDLACDGDHWRHSHNYEHHTFTNVIGKDRDIGYGFLRVSEDQPWRPSQVFQPLWAVWLALNFELGVATHDLRFPETFAGQQSVAELWERSQPFLRKVARQWLKDYLVYPALALHNAPRVAVGNWLANTARNLWTFSVIFCGHFPDGVQFFSADELENESRGRWYARQLNGSANLEGGQLFHVMTGHLSFQIEHHLFPDLPASRYPTVAPRVREIAERFGQGYATGSLRRQLGTVARRIVRYALPTRRRSRKPTRAPRPVEHTAPTANAQAPRAARAA